MQVYRDVTDMSFFVFRS